MLGGYLMKRLATLAGLVLAIGIGSSAAKAVEEPTQTSCNGETYLGNYLEGTLGLTFPVAALTQSLQEKGLVTEAATAMDKEMGDISTAQSQIQEATKRAATAAHKLSEHLRGLVENPALRENPQLAREGKAAIDALQDWYKLTGTPPN
jgi:hypothetical protein